MNNEEFLTVVDEVVVKCKKVLNKKGPGYSIEDDRFSNFRQSAGLQACSTKQALYGMMAKHLVAINDYIDKDADHEYVDKKEWNSKVLDAINYLFLLYGILREEEQV